MTHDPLAPLVETQAAAAKRRVSTGRLFLRRRARDHLLVARGCTGPSSWELLEHLRHLFVDSLDAVLRRRVLVHVLFGEASPHQLARPRVAHVDNQCSDDSLVNPVPCAGVQGPQPV